MTSILQLARDLVTRPAVRAVAGLRVRHYEGPADVEPWLLLRRRAFAEEEFGAGEWTRADFDREFLTKSWWAPNRMWLAESDEDDELVGTVTLAGRGEGSDARPVVHWLAVLPEWRRRGAGALLMASLEARAWDEGGRRIWLETHSKWQAALALYEARGYRPTDEG